MLAHAYFLWWGAQIVAVAILVALVLRWRPGFTGGRTIGEMLSQALDAREQGIRAQLEEAQRSREEAARIQEESERNIEHAREEANGIVSRASQTSLSIQEDIKRRAEEEYQRIVAQARHQIDYEREQAELALRRRAADIVIDAAGQIVQRHLEPQQDRELIVDSLGNVREVS
ncbi:MAG TPA: F0F1 ATP synthase subunit B [Chloroflexota bacterium]